jgi:3-(3-hydroxy-phenyl)propionate hydroxylase
VHLAQSVVCERLLAAIEARRPGIVHFGHKVLGFEQVGEEVHVRVRDRDQRESVVVGSRLCGADGVRSTVREAMGSTFVGEGRGDAFLSCVAGPQVMDLIARRMGVPSVAPVAYLYDKLDWTMVMQMRDRVRFLFRVLPGNEPERSLTREAMAIRARRFLGPGAEGHLRGLGVYSVKQRVASSWRQGRVMLLGDAAHQAMPVGGNAMNGGIHDAHHLSVALAAGTDAVLTAYETQRRRHALTLAARADESYKGLCARGLWSRMTRNRYLRRLSHDPRLARDHLLRVSMLEGRAGDAELPDLGSVS